VSNYPLFNEYSTATITPDLLAALAQVESAGNPVARTYWRKTQKRIAALVEFSAIGALADQLDAGGRVSRFSREKKVRRSKNANSHP